MRQFFMKALPGRKDKIDHKKVAKMMEDFTTAASAETDELVHNGSLVGRLQLLARSTVGREGGETRVCGAVDVH